MNKFEQLLRVQAAPLLAAGETLQAAGLLASGAWRPAFFLAAASADRLILVELERGVFGPKAVARATRDLPFRSLATLEGGRLLSPALRLTLHSGEALQLKPTQHLSIPFSQAPFVPRLQALFRAHQERAGLAPPSGLAYAGAPARESAFARLSANFARNPSLLRGLIAGAAAAVLSAVVWAAITVVTDYQISLMAIGVGLIVGGAVRIVSGRDSLAGGLGAAALSIAGCASGNLLWITYVVSADTKIGVVDALAFVLTHPDVALELMVAGFNALDIVFYAFAAYFSFRIVYGGRARPSQPGEQLGP